MTTAQFLDALRTVIDGDALREAEALAAEMPDAQHLAAELVRRNRLTQEQADRLLTADASHITAEAPSPKYAADFRASDDHERAVRPSSGGGGVVFLIVALVALLVCLPLAGVVVFALLGFGAFFFVAADRAAVEQELAADIKFNNAVKVEDARPPVPPDLPVKVFDPGLAPLRRFAGDTFRLSMDGAHILHGAAGKFSVSELNSGQKLIDLPPGRIPIGFTRNVPLEVASGGPGAIMPVILNDGVTGREVKSCPGVRGPITRSQMMPDGKMALFLRGADLILYDFAADKEPPVLLTLPEEPTDLAIASDGHSYLTGSDSGKVQLRSLKDDGKVVDYPGAIFSVACVALAPNGKHLLAGCENSVVVWDRDNPEKRLSFQHEQLLCAAFTPDSRRIWSVSKGGLFRLSDAQTGAPEAQFRYDAEWTALAFHPDGRQVISVTRDKVILVWNLPK